MKNGRSGADESSALAPADNGTHAKIAKNGGHKSRRSYSAFVCLLVILAQMLMVGSAFAQVDPATATGGNTGNAGNSLAPDANSTQGTAHTDYLDERGFVPAVNSSSPVNVNGGGNQYGSTRGIRKNVSDLIRKDNPMWQGQQTPPSSLVFQSAEQMRRNPQLDVSDLMSNSLGQINDTYKGMHQWFNDDIVGNLFSQIGQLIGKWISELIDGWIADTVQFLSAFLRVFVLNPNIAVNGLNGTPDDGISQLVRNAADVMYGIACDLLLLLFILAIWKYWVEASWRGGGNLMGAVGRLIATAGLMLAFPTLYAFEIQITNEMIKAIYFNSAGEVMMLDSALASAVRGGILAGLGGLVNAFAPLIGGATLGVAGGLVGEVFAFAGLVIFLILGGILIAELVYILVLKAIQTALLTAQYMFAPVFLVFFATPDTEGVATGFVRAWVETSLWTFVWVGLLKIMVIVMFSDYNPWGKILISVGVLQLMIQVPTFLARAQISPMSDFVSAGLITGGMLKMLGWMGNTAKTRLGQAVSYMTNDRYAASGVPQTGKPELNDVNRQAMDPNMVNTLKTASQKGQQKQTPQAGPPSMRTNQAGQAGQPGDPTQQQATAATPGVNTPGTGQNQASPQTPPSRTNANAAANPATNAAGNPATNGTANPATNAANNGAPVNAPTGPGAGVPPGANGTPNPANAAATPASGFRAAVRGAAAAGLAGGAMAAAGAAGANAGGNPAANPAQQATAQTPSVRTANAAAGGANPSMASVLGLDEDGEGRKLTDAKLGTGYYNGSGLYAVDAVRGIVSNIKNLKTRVREGLPGNTVEGTGRGGPSQVNLRAGATDAEKAHVLMSAGFAGRMSDDPAAADAARQAAIDSGADAPQGLWESAAANWLAYTGSTFKATATAKGRFQRAMFAQAVKGSEAYVNGNQGNAYTGYLKSRYGEWDQEKDGMAVWLATDPDAAESAWNPGIQAAGDALVASGLPFTAPNRGAIQNPYIMTMRPGARKAAVRALLRAAMYDSRMEGVDADSTAGGVLLGEIAKSMPASFVQSAIAVDAISGGKDTAPDNLGTWAQQSAELNLPADMVYQANNIAAPWVAAQVTGNNAMHGARNFDQIRRMVNVQYAGNPGRAAEVYQTILAETSDRVGMMNQGGISARIMTDPDFGGNMHQFIDSTADLGSRDSVQGTIAAAGQVVRQFGSAGFTHSKANAVYRVIQEGGNHSSMGVQEILVAERLVNSGASSVSTSTIQVLRNLDPRGTGNLSSTDMQMVDDIASAVDVGNCRADQAAAARNVLQSGRTITQNNVQVAARLMRQSGGFDGQTFRVETDVIDSGYARSAGEAHTLVTNCVHAQLRTAGTDPTGMALNQAIAAMQNIDPTYDVSSAGSQIGNIQRAGNFDTRQLSDPVIFEAAYVAQNFMPSNPHRVASIQIAERVHGAQALDSASMPGVLETYDSMQEAGVSPRDINQPGTLSMQRYYAARALMEYKAASGMASTSGPQPILQVLDRIRQDSRFNFSHAHGHTPPPMDAGLWRDVMAMRPWP